METKNMETQRDEALWKQAKKRVAFRKHFITYLAVITFFWVMWFLKDRNDPDGGGIPWPIFVTAGWGFGVLWHFLGAYVFTSKMDAVEREYEKLKNRK